MINNRISGGFIDCCATSYITKLPIDNEFDKEKWEVELLCRLEESINYNKSIMRIDVTPDTSKCLPFLERLGFTCSGLVDGYAIMVAGLLSQTIQDVLPSVTERLKTTKYADGPWLYHKELYEYLLDIGKLREHTKAVSKYWARQGGKSTRVLDRVSVIDEGWYLIHTDYLEYIKTLKATRGA